MDKNRKRVLSLVAFIVMAPPAWIQFGSHADDFGPQPDQILMGLIVGLLAAATVWFTITAVSKLRSPAAELDHDELDDQVHSRKRWIKLGFLCFASALFFCLIGLSISGRYYQVKPGAGIMQPISSHSYRYITRLSAGGTYRRSDLALSQEWFRDDGGGGFRVVPIRFGYVTRYVQEDETQIVSYPFLHPIFADVLYLFGVILIAVGVSMWSRGFAAVQSD